MSTVLNTILCSTTLSVNYNEQLRYKTMLIDTKNQPYMHIWLVFYYLLF